jgi:hypothetical protein
MTTRCRRRQRADPRLRPSVEDPGGEVSWTSVFSDCRDERRARSLAPEVRSSDRRSRSQTRSWLRPTSLEKRTSAAEAVKQACLYGTAEAVPFVRKSSQPLKGQCEAGCAVQIGQPKNLIWTGLTWACLSYNIIRLFSIRRKFSTVVVAA